MNLNLTMMLFLLPLSLQAANLKSTISGLTEILENPKVTANDCEELAPAGKKIPKIKKGEVKISYDCADFPTPAASVENQLEKETIKFYTDPELGDEISIRSRVNIEDPKKRDVTVKFRPKASAMAFDSIQYEKLKSGEDDDRFEMKCEADVSLGSEATDLQTV